MEPDAELRSYLESVRRLTGAITATMFIPADSAPIAAPLLIHAGAGTPVPELREQQPAARLHEHHRIRRPIGEAMLRRHESTAPNGYLLQISLGGFQSWVDGRLDEPQVRERRRTDRDGARDGFGTVWLGLDFDAGLGSIDGNPDPVPDPVPDPGLYPEASPRLAKGVAATLTVGTRLAWSLYQTATLLQDRITQLPGRVELQAKLVRLLEHSQRARRPVGLLLLSPDDFLSVNQRLGRDAGDRILGEIAERLRGKLRRSDLPYRYGGTVFAILLPDSNAEAARHVATKLRAAVSGERYLGHAMSLTFSIGGVSVEPGWDGQPELAGELVRRADAALYDAKLAGRGRTVFADMNDDAARSGSVDRLSGIFTADPEKDYRHMLLLWDTVNVISREKDPDVIARAFTRRIGDVFHALHVALLAAESSNGPSLMGELVRDPLLAFAGDDAASFALPERQRELLDRARHSRKEVQERLPLGLARGKGSIDGIANVLPLIVRERYVGWLYLAGPADDFGLDAADLLFLLALANQIARVLDHARLAEEWERKKYRERAQLKSEVRSLRAVLMQSKLVYTSAAMQALVERLRRVAPTDATVLITGESGTGKEILAKALHGMSGRRDRPMVTVDCGAIPDSLLESELFGRVKGAFTGADSAVPGRVVEADGGTLFLDEIGELPLPLQAKLLRFVQEKEVTPVGARRTRQVDVRILAATNRNLEQAVSLGHFRHDLFYRLKVFVVEAIPLRKRPDDILPLAQFFLEGFARQYGGRALSLSEAAKQALTAYAWPGNVRELQNSILEAVVMAQDETITQAHLDLPSVAGSASGRGSALRDQGGGSAWAHQTEQASAPERGSAEAAAPAELDAPRSRAFAPSLTPRRALLEQVELALGDPTQTPPLGRWLQDDLLLLAEAACDGVVRKTAAAIGVPESSCRRQLAKAKKPEAAGRSTHWGAMRPVLHAMLDAYSNPGRGSLLLRARRLLLDVVNQRLRDDDRVAAALMGVTTTTYRRWRQGLADSPDCGDPT